MKQLPFLSTPPTWSPAAANRRRPAVIVPLQSTEPNELHLTANRIAATGVVDAIEWRIDQALAELSSGPGTATVPTSTSTVASARADSLAEAVLELAPNVLSAGLPVLVTLRTAIEGGVAEVGDEDYGTIIGRIIEGLNTVDAVPVAVDVEIDREASSALIARAHDRGLTVVASHHNFGGTDSQDDLSATYDRMADVGADVAKIAMMPANARDVTTVLNATAEADARLSCPVLGISMGELGRTTRILGADFGSCATFAQLGLASAPGQIDVRELAHILDSLYG
ncbi:type I 3-dehydroquinate dehydratase [Brevibacterium sp.]|uniref:type I 3-dehydroquinate dehydratase n=1 Tax=Brevibacterium sp. TaxID=1701 RepID=UPI002810AC0A|nr:type I 3-dehydroquinate dehydratase [Brevibacterium sp.]